MALKTTQADGRTGSRNKVLPDGEAVIVVAPYPFQDTSILPLPYRQYFTDDGLSAGTNDMRVDGSSVNVGYYIPATSTHDIYIKTISVIVADASATLAKFGNLTALTNGVEFKHVTQDLGETIIHEGVKTNLAFVRLALGRPAFGDGTSAFRADLTGSGADAYLPVIDISTPFGLPWGLRLRRGTLDKLVFTVKDDLSTGIDQFDIIGFGIKIG